MPTGVIINALSVAAGGLLGTLLKNSISDKYKDNLNMIFGISSIGMGITSIILMQNMPAVILALILGTVIGLALNFGRKIAEAAAKVQSLIGKTSSENDAALLTVIVLFCASGTGIYGALVSGMNGDHSILIAKSILDFFTAMIFACMLGKTVSAIAVPQCVIMLALYFIAGTVFPLTTPDMINDFKACGGFIMAATGFRILQLKQFPTADMIPAMIIVMPLSWLWTMLVIPLLG